MRNDKDKKISELLDVSQVNEEEVVYIEDINDINAKYSTRLAEQKEITKRFNAYPKLVDMVEELVNKEAYHINIPDDLQNSGTRYFLAESLEHANQIVTRLKVLTKYPDAISIDKTKWFRSFSELDKAQQLLMEYEGMKAPQEIALKNFDKDKVKELIDNLELALKTKCFYEENSKLRGDIYDLKKQLESKDKEIQSLKWREEDLKRKIRNYYK